MQTLRTTLSLVLLLAMLLVLAPPAQAQSGDLPDASGLIVESPGTVEVAASLRAATGPVQVVVQLGSSPLATNSEGKSREQRRAYKGELGAQQDALLSRLRGQGARELARLKIALNAVVLEIDAAQIPVIESLPDVRSIRPVGSYELSLDETVGYIGARAVQSAGFNGTGVAVAVLDSGIDYTHAALGGEGTLDAYAAAYGTSTSDPKNTTLDGLFPTAKVVGGYDFVGEAWPNSALAPDPDPIDFEGHGTHVADIIAGAKGVAPGASLYAVKVCSAVSSSCSGIALLQGVEFSLDPNGDGDIADRVDVINMSLGSSYGQIQDDLSEASANAVRAGVVVVASAGNSADRPYITGSPASTPQVISVAQTQVPSAVTFALQINSPASIAGQYKNTETLSWAPVGAGFTGDVVFVGRGCNIDPYLADPAGKVALIDRGACNISEKVFRASEAGATGVLIGLVAAGDAVTFSNGGECPVPPDGTCKPSLVIIQSTANAIKARLTAGDTVNVTVSPAITTALVGSMVGSSARGPSYSFNTIKPDIGAPGASISAIAGTGTATEAFGGTSGAAPMVAGAAALLLQAKPDRSPAEIKSLLMNTAETNIFINPATQPGVLAPITRIGGGEVRVDRALASSTAAWDASALAGSLSFGYQPVSERRSFTRRVLVQNYGSTARTYAITPGFRYADDAASGAIKVEAPSSIRVPAGRSRMFNVKVTVDPTRLPTWNLNGGTAGGNGALLQGVEFDGYLTIADAADTVRLAWQILPHRSSAVEADDEVELYNGMGTLVLENESKALAGAFDVFSLTGTSKQVKKSTLPGPGDNFAVVDLRAVGARLVGIGGGQLGVQFAVSTYGRRAHPNYPAEFDVYIDNNRDGNPDVVIFNAELNGFAATGQNVVNVVNLATGAGGPVFFTDADLNSENVILTAPLAALGLTPGTQFDFSIYAFDNYFTGELTDAIEGMTYTLGTPRYFASGATSVPANGTATLMVEEIPGGATASPSQEGLLIFHRDNKTEREASVVKVEIGKGKGKARGKD